MWRDGVEVSENNQTKSPYPGANSPVLLLNFLSIGSTYTPLSVLTLLSPAVSTNSGGFMNLLISSANVSIFTSGTHNKCLKQDFDLLLALLQVVDCVVALLVGVGHDGNPVVTAEHWIVEQVLY